jgi:preprotein translocase subunit SecA
MLTNLLKKIFGSRNDRMIKQYAQTVRMINDMESSIAQLSDADIRNKTDEFKQLIAD